MITRMAEVRGTKKLVHVLYRDVTPLTGLEVYFCRSAIGNKYSVERGEDLVIYEWQEAEGTTAGAS